MMTPEESRRERERIIARIAAIRKDIAQQFTDAESWNDNNPFKARIVLDPDGSYAAYAESLDKWLVAATMSEGQLPSLPIHPDER